MKISYCHLRHTADVSLPSLIIEKVLCPLQTATWLSVIFVKLHPLWLSCKVAKPRRCDEVTVQQTNMQGVTGQLPWLILIWHSVRMFNQVAARVGILYQRWETSPHTGVVVAIGKLVSVQLSPYGCSLRIIRKSWQFAKGRVPLMMREVIISCVPQAMTITVFASLFQFKTFSY